MHKDAAEWWKKWEEQSKRAYKTALHFLHMQKSYKQLYFYHHQKSTSLSEINVLKKGGRFLKFYYMCVQ